MPAVPEEFVAVPVRGLRISSEDVDDLVRCTRIRGSWPRWVEFATTTPPGST
jgi:hypothetical protein